MSFDRQPTVQGDGVSVRPLLAGDRDGLFAVARDPEMWDQHPDRERWRPEVFERFWEAALASGGALAVLDDDGTVIGTSRYADYDPVGDEVQIGWTFLARRLWGGPTNAELKRLMLDHAFRSVSHVVFLIGMENWRSQRAVEKLGARRAGIRLDGAGDERACFLLDRPGE